MEYRNLISPEFKVEIGAYVLEDGIEVEYISSKEAHADWCRIHFTEELIGHLSIHTGDEVTVELGYEDDYDRLLVGSVGPLPKEEWKEFIVKDDFRLLETISIKATFVKCTPQDIVKYLLTAAGIGKFELSEAAYGDRDIFVAESMSASEVLKTINTFWGISIDYYFWEGIFYWGCKPKQDYVYVLEEGNNILNLEPYGTMWCADTIGIPWIHHSQIIEVEHTLYSGQGEVQKVVLNRDEKGFVRQNIYFLSEAAEE